MTIGRRDLVTPIGAGVAVPVTFATAPAAADSSLGLGNSRVRLDWTDAAAHAIDVARIFEVQIDDELA